MKSELVEGFFCPKVGLVSHLLLGTFMESIYTSELNHCCISSDRFRATALNARLCETDIFLKKITKNVYEQCLVFRSVLLLLNSHHWPATVVGAAPP